MMKEEDGDEENGKEHEEEGDVTRWRSKIEIKGTERNMRKKTEEWVSDEKDDEDERHESFVGSGCVGWGTEMKMKKTEPNMRMKTEECASDEEDENEDKESRESLHVDEE